MSTARIPLAQPLTLDFNLVAVRNAERGLGLLGAAAASDLAGLRAEVAALASRVAAAGNVTAHDHSTLGGVLTLSTAQRSVGVNAPAPAAALDVRPGATGTPVLSVKNAAGAEQLVVAANGRVAIRPPFLSTKSVSAVNVEAGGYNYWDVVVELVGGGGTGASAFALIDEYSGAITAILVESGGTGYSSAPAVVLWSEYGTGAAATAVISDFDWVDAQLHVSGDGVTPALNVVQPDGVSSLRVDAAGRVGVGPTGALTVPMKVQNGGSGATLRVEGPVTGGYATSGVIEVLSSGVLQGSFDGANVGDGYGLFNFFGSPGATRFGELNFLDRTASGDRRVCTFYVNSLAETTGEFGLVMRSGSTFVYGLTINASGQVIVGGNTPGSPTCSLEVANGFFHQAGDLGFFGMWPAGQQSVATADIAFSCPAPSTPDYSFAATSGGYGFSSADEFNSCMAVLAALQSRLNQIVSALQAYGLLA